MTRWTWLSLFTAGLLLAGCGSSDGGGGDGTPPAEGEGEGEGEGPAEGEGEGAAEGEGEGEGEGPAEGEGEGPAEGEGEGEACTDDPLEDNDAAQDSVAMEPGDRILGLVVCPGDEDWFRVPVGEGDVVTATVELTRADGLLELVLFDGAFEEVGTGTGDGDRLDATATASAAGTTFLVVRGATEEVANGYSLKVAVEEAPGCQRDEDCEEGERCDPFTGDCVPEGVCVEDDREPDDGAGEAREVVPGQYEGLSLCGADEDWSRLELEAGESLRVAIRFQHAAGDLDLEVLRGGVVVADSDTVSDDEEVALPDPSAGTYTIRVYAEDERVQTRYTLVVETGCGQDDDCPGSQTCDEGTGRCTEGLGCLTDRDCVGDRLCDVGAGQCEDPEDCVPDDDEGNDEPEDAVLVEAGRREGLTLCPGDEDWWAVQVPFGAALVGSIHFEHDDGDLDLQLVSPDGRAVRQTSDGTDDVERVQLDQAPSAGAWLLRVYAFEQEANDYALEVEVIEGGLCVDDDHDAGDGNDDADHAVAMLQGLWPDLRICPGDEDWWVISLEEDERLTAGVLFDHADGDLDAALYAPGGGDALVEADSRTDDEELVWVAREATDVLLQVVGVGQAKNDYQLSVAIRPVPPACDDDEFEPNDVAGQAPATVSGEWAALTICEGDEDWFALALEAGDGVAVEIEFDPALMNLDAWLLEPDGERMVASTGGVEGLKRFEVGAVESAGRYLVKVTAAGQAQGAYRLAIEVSAGGFCEDDGHEGADGNDTREDALRISPGPLWDAVLCAGTEDWFHLGGPPGDEVHVDLFFEHGEGDLDLEIWPEVGNAAVAVGDSETDNEHLQLVAGAGENVYYVRVLGATADDEADYALYVTRVSGVQECPQDDDREPDDSPLTAAALAPGDYPGRVLCSGEEDWYQVDIAAGQVFTAEATLAPALGDLDLWLVGPYFGAVAISSENPNADRESLWLDRVGELGEGTYYLRVFSPDGAGNTYDLTMALQ